MTRPLAVYTDMEDIDPAAGILALEQAGYTVLHLGSKDADVIAEAAADAEALLVGYAPISAALMDRLPRLRIIALVSMGFDNVDVDAATERGIWVTNLPGVATEEVATHTLALALAAVRNLSFFTRTAANGEWISRPANSPPRLREHTLGIIGLGRIGTRFAEIAGPLFGEVVGYDPLLPDDPDTRARVEAAGIRRTTLDDVISRALVLSLHVPLTNDTRNLLNAETIARMKPGSFIVNVSRGELIDDNALCAALDTGQIAAAALDVLDEEPPTATHPLLDRPDITLTPHIAFLSDRTLTEYIRLQAENVIEFARTGHPTTPLNALARASTRSRPRSQMEPS